MKPMLHRPYLAIFSIVLVLLVLASGIFILTFDLNRYREEVQTSLTSVLGRPITLGEAHLSFSRGLALKFSAVKVPATPNGNWSLEAGSLLARLKLRPLLGGKAQFSEIVLVSPRLRLILRQDLPPGRLEIPEWGHFGIRALTIRDGRLEVEDLRATLRPLHLLAEDVNLRLLDFASGQRAWLTLAGKIRQTGAPALLDLGGEVVPAADLRQSSLNLALKLDGLDAAVLAPYLPDHAGVTGSLSLRLNLSKTAISGLKIAGEVHGEEITAAMPDWYETPLAIQKLHLSGTWMQENGRHRLSDFSLNLDALAASGNLLWQQENEKMWLDVTLATPVQPVAELARLIPDRGPAATVKKRLAGGSWQIEHLHYAGTMQDLGAPDKGLPLQGKVHISDLRLIGTDDRLGNASFAALFGDDRLQFDGAVDVLDTPVRFAGAVEHPFSPQRQISAEVKGSFPLARLRAELPAATQENFTASGQLPFTGTLAGNPSNITFTVDSRFDRASLSFGANIGQPIPLAGTLAFAGTFTETQVELARARLQLPAIDLRGKGHLERTGSKGFALALQFAGLDLEKLRPHFAFLDKIEGKGVLDGNCNFTGAAGRLASRSGAVHLRDAGLHLTTAIAPLSKISGRLRWNEEQIDLEEVTASLGNSPISIAGALHVADAFRADLRVRGKSIRANELIFSSEQLLRDVDGRLSIDRQGIQFAPATVRLDGGTEASVRGEVTFAPPLVNLDIEAPQGNIDEVIALWQKPTAEKTGPPAGEKPGHGNGVRVRIGARVGEGTLGNLHFQQAEGEILYSHNLLEIFPLRFRIGPGNCLGRVSVEFGDGVPLLKTSGHLEKVDAAAIYQELLKRRGLITGTLHGDFYLEGRLGSQFLRTSTGGFNFETRDGVLRKFAVLGKIFSLLNVSQILTLQLPDMAKDGMPFQRLTGNFALRQGVLSTEDLFVESPAMNLSVVGEMDLPAEKIDMIAGIKPLRTVDKIITSIPLAGWILAGEEKALITVHFHIYGHPDRTEVDAVPITSISEKALGIFRRVLNLPGKMIDDVSGLVREK